MDRKKLWEIEISFDGKKVFDRVFISADSIREAMDKAETGFRETFKEAEVQTIGAKLSSDSFIE